MPRDYYSVLVRATSALDPNTAESRQALYDRARHAVANARLSIGEIRNERFALEAAIQQVEADLVGTGQAMPAGAMDQTPNEIAETLRHAAAPTSEPKHKFSPLLICGLAAAAILAGGIIGYQYWPKVAANRGDVQKTAPMPTSDVDRAPSTSEDSNLSFIFRRQLVYYRSIQPVGTIVIAKSQRFLYLILPNTVALRYTIGVGRECANVVGLLLVSAKEDWTEPNPPTPTNNTPPTVTKPNRGIDGQLGARSLALGETAHRIHGTRETVVSGATGCFPLINDDVIDLYNRVALGTRVVMN